MNKSRKTKKSLIKIFMKKIIKPLYNIFKKYYLNFQKRLDEHRQFIFYKKIIGNDKLVFDVGANIGTKTELFNRLGNRVVAIEPQSYCYEILKEKFKNNPKVKIVNKGIGDKSGEATLHTSTKYRGFSSLKEFWQKGTKYDSFDGKETIKLTTLENLITEYGLPYFCKIDVEGFELEVLNGLQSKIPCLNFEFHGELFNLIKKCLNRLNELGYKLFNYVESEGNFKIKSWVSMVDLKNILEKKINNNNQIWGDIYAK